MPRKRMSRHLREAGVPAVLAPGISALIRTAVHDCWEDLSPDWQYATLITLAQDAEEPAQVERVYAECAGVWAEAHVSAEGGLVRAHVQAGAIGRERPHKADLLTWAVPARETPTLPLRDEREASG